MKYLLIILLFYSTGFAQIDKKKIFFEDGLDVDTQIYVNSLTTPLSGQQVSLINNLVLELKAGLQISRLQDAFDVLYLLANETAEAGLKNLVKRSHDATNVNSTTFTQYEGFTGNGSSMYINTNYNAATQGVNYTLNNSSIGIYSRSDITESTSDMGADNGTNRVRLNLNTANTLFSSVNDNNTGTTASTSSLGFFISSRRNSTENPVYRNGTLLNTFIVTSTAIPSVNIFICARNISGTPSFHSTRQYAISFVGRGFTAGEVTIITNAFEKYMDAIGKGVIP